MKTNDEGERLRPSWMDVLIDTQEKEREREREREREENMTQNNRKLMSVTHDDPHDVTSVPHRHRERDSHKFL